MIIPETTDLFDLSHTIANELLRNTVYPYEALPLIKNFVIDLGKMLDKDEYNIIGDNVYIAKDVKLYPTAVIEGPAIICRGTEIRPGAFIRGSVIIGENCVIGNSTEIKNSIIFDNVQIPHYNYVGDSILGYRSHMGAGAIASNFKLDHSNICIKMGYEKINTELRKFGVMLGDFSEIGCGCVTNPGTIIGKNTLIYPLTSIRGIIPSDSIVGKNGEIKDRR